MKRLAVVVVVAIALWFWWHRGVAHEVPPATAASATTAAAPPAPATTPIAHVKKLSPDERRDVAAQIDRARQVPRGGVRAAGPEPKLPPIENGDELRVSIRAAMKEAIPFIIDCYEQALPTLKQSRLVITAKLELTGDRDIGTLIDAPELVDEHGDPLPAKFDDCMRTAMQQLELPPLAEGDHVLVHYPFVFDKN